MNYPSKLIENAVNEISKLPGIGKKTALRLVLHLLKQKENTTIELADALLNLRTKVQYCSICHNVADNDICGICNNHRRDNSLICVVEDLPDVMAIENTSQFQGLYHVLGGVISPIQGIGPDELHIDTLLKRVRESHESKTPVQEVILALPATMEGDTTVFFISRRLKEFGVRVSTIARGIPVGGELEFTDEVTLGRSILGRVNYTLE